MKEQEEFLGLWPNTQWFANEMQRRLEENDHKSGWRELTNKRLLRHLRKEVDELEQAIQEGKSTVVSEAADVANFVMMIADNFTEKESEE